MSREEPGEERAAAPESFDREAVVGEVYLTAEQLAVRVGELAAEISRDYAGRVPLLVSVLKGAVFFLADLARALDIEVELDFLAITSYSQEAPGQGVSVRFLKDLDRSIEGRDVLLVEDIIDTGLTLHYITRALQIRGPASLEICTLLDRPYRRLIEFPVRYRGFTVPDDFFVGYGFDHLQRFRNLPYLAFVRPDAPVR